MIWIEVDSNIPDKEVLVMNRDGNRLYGAIYYDTYNECYCATDGYRHIKHCTHYIEID
jgi:hypothetical protein